MSLKDRLYEDMKTAMKAGDKQRTETVRMAISAIKKEQIDSGKELDEAAEVTIVQRAVKQRRESAEAYDKANRADLADKERAEIEILAAYLPQQLSDEELEAAARKLIAEAGATSAKDLGKVMPKLMAAFKGQVDGNRARAVITKLLG